MNSTRTMLERMLRRLSDGATANLRTTTLSSSRRQATARVSCDRDHVSHVYSSAVRLAHVDGVLIGPSFFCTACDSTVVVRSSVQVTAALYEFGVVGLRFVDDRSTPTVVSDDRRLLSIRLLVDDRITEIVDPPRSGRAADDRLSPDIGLIPT